MGFVKVPHDLKKWEWFTDAPTLQVYIWLLLSAAWSDSRYKGAELKRGQVITTYPEMVEECEISTQQLRTILTRLKATGKITVNTMAKFSIITLLEYDGAPEIDSQSNSPETVGQQPGNSLPAVEQQAINSPSLYKEYKEEKEEKKTKNTAPAAREEVFSPEFEKFWSSYPKKTAKVQAFKAFVKLDPDEELLNTMLSFLERQKKSAQWTKDDGQYIPYPATWLNGRRWEDEPTETLEQERPTGLNRLNKPPDSKEPPIASAIAKKFRCYNPDLIRALKSFYGED